MAAAIVGVLSLGVVAIIIRDFTQSGSQGPAVLQQVDNGVTGFYNAIGGAAQAK